MTIVATAAAATTVHPCWAFLPWHDDHPDRLDLDRQLPREHLARRIEAGVERLDLRELYGLYHGTGSAPYDPKLLLQAVLYEMRSGRHHPPQWYDHACHYTPVRWLLRGYRPSRSCWYNFRDRIAPLLVPLNSQILTLAIAEDLTPANRGAGDGTSAAANASRHRLLNEANLNKRVQQLDCAIAADLPQDAGAAAADAGAAPAVAAAPATAAAAAVPRAAAPAATAPAGVPGWMAKQPAGRKSQRQRYHQAQQQLAQRLARNQAKMPAKRTAPTRLVISTSDPEAALGLDKEKVFRPLYNVQLVDDLDSPLILGYEVFAQPNDAGLLGPLLQRTRELLGHSLDVILTDMGYVGGADLHAAATAGVTVYAPLPKEDPKAKQLPKSAFRWLPEAQTYQCPQGHRLHLESKGQTRRSGPERLQVQRYRCPPVHCAACPLQQQCAKNPQTGRTVSRSEYEEEVEALRQRLASAEAKALYKLRKQTVELLNADLKEHRQLRRFSGRGLTRVRCQVGLLVLAHNLLTLLAEEKKKVAASAAVSPTDIAT